MTQFLQNHLDAIIAFVSGGGLLSVISISATKKKAEAEAMKQVQQVYQETIRDLRFDKAQIREENSEIRQSMHEMQKQLDGLMHDVQKLKKLKCTVIECKLRKRD